MRLPVKRKVAMMLVACGLVYAFVPAMAEATVASAPVSISQFVKKANQICIQANTQRDTLLQSYAAKLAGKLPDNATLTAAVGEYQPILQQEIDSLSTLQPPKALQAKYRHLLTSARSALSGIVANPTSLLALATGGKGPLDTVSRQARVLGLRACAN